jgi:serine/threonine protein kinase
MTIPYASIRRFDLERGRLLGGKYVVEELLGEGWEGEVYRVRERQTRIRRAAKLFYPERNLRNRTAARYARKLEKLRLCPIVAQYHHSESLRVRGVSVTCLISELVEGESISEYVDRQSGRRMQPFEALHLLHALVVGLECIHRANEYHGDLHADNVLVRRAGIRFEVKVFDFFYRGRASRQERQEDLIDAIRLFYDSLGGRRFYARHPPEVKTICCGLKHTLIRKKFPTSRKLREHLESFAWTE